jgi:hypothetical protein
VASLNYGDERAITFSMCQSAMHRTRNTYLCLLEIKSPLAFHRASFHFPRAIEDMLTYPVSRKDTAHFNSRRWTHLGIDRAITIHAHSTKHSIRRYPHHR